MPKITTKFPAEPLLSQYWGGGSVLLAAPYWYSSSHRKCFSNL